MPANRTNSHLLFDRGRVRAQRRRAAARAVPDAPDFLLQRYLDDVCDRLRFVNRAFSRVLIIGSQQGRVAKALRTSIVIPELIETDVCEHLLTGASGHRVVADEEALPFADATFDLIIGGLTMQWVNDLPGTLVQIRRILKPDGLFLCGIAGGATLKELRLAWLQAETEVRGGVSPRVAPTADVRDLGALLQRAGFALPVVDADVIAVQYSSPLILMAELKSMGAGHALMERSRTPVTRGLLMRAAQIYSERFGLRDGRVAATFEILTMTAWGPDQSQQQPLAPGSARMRLADALGTREHSLPGDVTADPSLEPEEKKR
jgi:SAM-dependent methyltransferase